MCDVFETKLANNCGEYRCGEKLMSTHVNALYLYLDLGARNRDSLPRFAGPARGTRDPEPTARARPGDAPARRVQVCVGVSRGSQATFKHLARRQHEARAAGCAAGTGVPPSRLVICCRACMLQRVGLPRERHHRRGRQHGTNRPDTHHHGLLQQMPIQCSLRLL